MKNNIIYLDSAATSFPKPKSVLRAVGDCLENYCGNAGRGSHKLSLFAANKVYDCRQIICDLINAPRPENIIFVPSCTYGLNLIIKGLLKSGDHVLISDMEHNATFRPIHRLFKDGLITYSTFSALSQNNKSYENILADIESKIKNNTKLLICNHQSNICSYSLPIEKIGALCEKHHIIFALDVAQSIGHINIDMQKSKISFLSAPGHKGLYGIQGAAFVAINSAYTLDTLLEGGNGVDSLLPEMSYSLPERHESGTLPLPAIVGLYEGIKEIKRRTIDEISAHEKELFDHLRNGLMNIKDVTVYEKDFTGNTLSFNHNKIPADLVATALDNESICTRAGFHCSALAHRSLGTDESGAVRVSFGIYNDKKQLDKLLIAINNICKF